jgi:hypothetical protein
MLQGFSDRLLEELEGNAVIPDRLVSNCPFGFIPDQVLGNVNRGDCVLFLGADLLLDYRGALLLRHEPAPAPHSAM